DVQQRCGVGEVDRYGQRPRGQGRQRVQAVPEDRRSRLRLEDFLLFAGDHSCRRVGPDRVVQPGPTRLDVLAKHAQVVAEVQGPAPDKVLAGRRRVDEPVPVAGQQTERGTRREQNLRGAGRDADTVGDLGGGTATGPVEEGEDTELLGG